MNDRPATTFVQRVQRLKVSSRAEWVIGAALSAVCGLVLVASQFPAAGNDDSHITYWAAHTLAEYGRIVNYNGQAVEQSSSLAFVVLLALTKLLGLEPAVAGWSASIAFGILTAVELSRAASALGRGAAFIAPLLVASWLPFAYWSTSGMEMTLAALLGCVVVRQSALVIDAGAGVSRKRWGFAVASLFVFTTVRPESPVVALSTLGFVVVVFAISWFRTRDDVSLRKLRRAGLLWLAAALCFAAIVGFRQLVFHASFPNPANIKTGGFSLASGGKYLMNGFELAGWFLPGLALAGVALVARAVWQRNFSSTEVLALGLACAGLAFVMGSGGDWMPGARLLVPTAPALALLAGRALSEALRAPLLYAALATLVLTLNVKSAVAFGRSSSNGSYRGEAASRGAEAVGATASNYAFSELGNKAHRRDARLLAHLMKQLEKIRPTPERPVYIMSGQAGMVPYYVFRKYYGAARFIDLFALTSSAILPCLPANQKKAQVHGIRLSSDYIIKNADRMDPACGAKRPDIVFSTGRCPENLPKNGYVCTYQGPSSMNAFVAIDRRILDERER